MASHGSMLMICLYNSFLTQRLRECSQMLSQITLSPLYSLSSTVLVSMISTIFNSWSMIITIKLHAFKSWMHLLQWFLSILNWRCMSCLKLSMLLLDRTISIIVVHNWISAKLYCSTIHSMNFKCKKALWGKSYE